MYIFQVRYYKVKRCMLIFFISQMVGMVVRDVGDPIYVHKIHLQFFGEQRSCIFDHQTPWENESQSSNIKGEDLDNIEFFKHDVVMRGNNIEKLQSGTYCFPFEFVLPPNLPPSFSLTRNFTK